MPQPGIEVRRARTADAAAVTRLLAGIYAERRYFVGDAPVASGSLAARIATDDPRRSLYLVAVCGRWVAGWLELHRSHAWRLEHVSVLTRAVAPFQRRLGVWRSLLRLLFDWGHEVGFLNVCLHVRVVNAAAIAL